MNNWPTKKLGEICSIKKGKKPVLRKIAIAGDLPYLIAKFLRGTKEPEYASADDKGSVVVQENETIIICDGSNSGDIFTGFKGILSSTMGKINHEDNIDTQYLKIFLVSNFDLFNGAKKGAAIPHLDIKALYNLRIPLPPIVEQQKIVKKIEELFGEIDKAQKLREEAQKDAAALVPAALHHIFSRGKKKGWREISLGDKKYIKMTSGGTPSRGNRSYYDGSIAWLKSGELNDNQNILDSEEHITEDAIKNSSAKVFPKNTVLFAMYGATAGKTGILVKEAATNQAVAGLICSEESIYYRYVFQCLMNIRNDVIAQAWGGAQPNLSQTIIKKFKIPLPSLPEQKKIVEYLDSLSEKTRNLQKLQEKTAGDFKALKQSILHKAFAGELI